MKRYQGPLDEHMLVAIAAPQKTTFDDDHPPDKPIEFFFQESHQGLILFVIFYTLACRWKRCAACALPHTSSSHHVDFQGVMKQVDHVFGHPDVEAQRHDIRKIILSNQGSLLDEETFSSTALMYLMASINRRLPAVELVTMETRAEYVDEAELEFLARALAEGAAPAQLELAIGFEAFDDAIRNRDFHKGLPLPYFEELVQKVAQHGFHLKCYFMQKPVPGLSDDAAVADIQAAIDYLAGLSEVHQVEIDMHLNPTYVARGTPLAEAFAQGRFEPPRLVDVARAVLRARDCKLTVFIGLNDEGLAVPGGSFLRPGDQALVQRLERFNRTQDFQILEDIVGA